MTDSEFAFWKSHKGKRVVVDYDPPDDTGVVVGTRRARVHRQMDAILVRFDDSPSVSSLWPWQIKLLEMETQDVRDPER